MKRWVGLSMVLAMLFSMMTIPAMAQDTCDGDDLLICGEIRDYYNANNGAAMFGEPLSNAFTETRFDTGASYSTQYFQRARIEHHPANAGTGYELQLGRLGVEVLQAQGRDWQTEPKASPSTANYMDATGQAIAPEFWETWRSNGLDLGDTGISFRESLALFGYPITGVEGDDIQVQWFERARFELRDGQVTVANLGAQLLAVPGVDDAEVAASLAQVQQAVAVNHDLDVALDGGWGLIDGLDHCFDNPGVGGMGFHYINVDLLDLELDPLMPEAMVYYLNADDELVLGAVEWIVPAEPWDAENDELPQVMGRHLHLNEALGVYVMHAWAFLDNPAGAFEDWHPDIMDCRLIDHSH